jgi:hypothetical protein
VRHFATEDELEVLDEALALRVLDPVISVTIRNESDPLWGPRARALRVLETILRRMAGQQKLRATGRDPHLRRVEFDFEALCDHVHWIDLADSKLYGDDGKVAFDAIRIELDAPEEAPVSRLSEAAEPRHESVVAPAERNTDRQPRTVPTSARKRKEPPRKKGGGPYHAMHQPAEAYAKQVLGEGKFKQITEFRAALHEFVARLNGQQPDDRTINRWAGFFWRQRTKKKWLSRT